MPTIISDFLNTHRDFRNRNVPCLLISFTWRFLGMKLVWLLLFCCSTYSALRRCVLLPLPGIRHHRHQHPMHQKATNLLARSRTAGAQMTNSKIGLWRLTSDPLTQSRTRGSLPRLMLVMPVNDWWRLREARRRSQERSASIGFEPLRSF